ncbi:MAG: hypothetical protein IJT94_10005, partial [Oscillibacter sp.]|nr:hypothetical protein [Oscillibacter sp.]
MRHRGKQRGLFILASVLILSLFHGARAADGPYLYGATQYGGARTVDVRLRNAEAAVLALGVYDRADHQLHALLSQTAAADGERHILSVTLDEPTLSTEYVRAFLLDPDTLCPLCIPVLADYVIPYPDDENGEEPPDTEEDPDEVEPPDTEEDPDEVEPPDTEEDPSEVDPPDTEKDPSEQPDIEPDPAGEPETRILYATPSGKK